MRAFFRRLVVVLVLTAGVGGSLPAQAQVADVRVLETGADGTTLEVTARWPRSLQAGVDSIQATALTYEALHALTGGFLDVVETVPLLRATSPRVQVLAADFDEVTLPAAADTALAALEGPQAAVTGVGTLRKRPVATVNVRLWSYEAGRLRRYRRVVVRLPGSSGAAAAAGKSFFQAAECTVSSPHLSVKQSALADGVLFKIPVTAEGIYRLDRAALGSLLNGTGVSLNSLRPEQIRIYGNGGAPLPARNAVPRPADLIENPVLVRTSGGAVSEVLFYGKGPTGWTYDAAAGAWTHYVHPFSNQNYYFLKVATGGGAGARVGEGTFPGYPDAAVTDRVTGRAFRDFDEVMWSKEGGTGHTWVSMLVTPSGRLDALTGMAFPGLAGGRVVYTARVAVSANPAAAVRFSSGGRVLRQETLPGVSRAEDATLAYARETTFEETVADGQALGVAMTLQDTGGDPNAALDWMRVFYPQALRAENGMLRFSTPAGATGRYEFVLRGFTQPPQVWDVTAPGAVQALGVQRRGDAYHVQVEVTDAGRPRELFAFAESAARAPEGVTPVANQNLHGLTAAPAFVIVTPDTFRVQAEELADRRRRDGLRVEVVDVRRIYNEFSGGLQDARAIRDYFKFLYDHCENGEPVLQYALLFGDGHFNYRGLGGEKPTLRNWILPFETEESFHPMESYTSDDYFGLLDEDEGEWSYRYAEYPSVEQVDIGIGRFPVQNVREAAAMLHKIKHYESPATHGPWRTRYAFVADDGYTGLSGVRENWRDLHVQNADVVAEMVRQLNPEINVEKIYGPSYDRVFAGIYKLPGARQDILGALDEGLLLLNYSGHGGVDGLAQEEIFTKEDAARLDNLDHLTVFVTATCSFGRWDMADEQSAAEVLLSNPNGGAVALLTTVRTVYTSPSITSLNVGLNRELNRELFKRAPDGRPRRLGDALRLAKNTTAGRQSNNRKFSLLGDPTMRLGLPALEAAVTTVNGQPLGAEPAPLRALDRVTLRGEIRRPDGSVSTGFNGLVHVAVYDAARNVKLPYRDVMPTDHYTVREDLIWRGEVKATAGQFDATFVVPKDISYSNQAGRIAVYARAGEEQAAGATENVVVGGSSDRPVVDHQGPALGLFLNDTTFVSGGLTTPRPELIVKLQDESGINTVGAGVGHEMLLVVDGDQTRALNISRHYESEPDSYQRGQVRFPLVEYLRQLNREAFTPGLHTVEVKAWDVLNNASTATLDFFVTNRDDLTLRNIYNYPNPMAGETRFVFEHNQPSGTAARLQIRIYTLAGQPVRTLDTEEALPVGLLPAGLVQVPWDGRDEDFDPLAPGVYLYKVRLEVEQPDGERQVSEQVERLAIIR